MDQYYYLDENGVIQTSGGDIPGWEGIYFARVDGTISGYPIDFNQNWDFTNDVWFYPKVFLKQQLLNYRNSLLNAHLTFEGMTIYLFGDPFYQHTGMAARALLEDPTATRAFMPVTDKEVVNITNQDIIDAWYFAIDTRQDIVDAAWLVSVDIDNEVVTDPTEVAPALDTYMGTPTSRTYVQSYYDSVAQIADQESRISDLETTVSGMGAIPATFDDLTDGSTNVAFTTTLRTKLNGIASGATANDTDANLKARANHTGTQTASTISDFNTAADARITAQKGANGGLATLDSGGKIPTTQLPAIAITSTSVVASQVAQLALTAQEGDVAVRSDLNKSYIQNGGSAGTMADWTELLAPTGGVSSFNGRTGTVSPASNDYTCDQIADGSTNRLYTATEKTKLAGLDINRQITVYSGTTVKNSAVLYCSSATISSGTATIHLTADGTSGGTPIFANGPITASANIWVSDETASYQTKVAWSNSNKTATITANKLTTANILTGILGQAQANSASVYFQVWGN